MHVSTFRQWLKRIYTTQEDEIDCDGVLELLPGYVETEESADPRAHRYLRIAQHLGQCAECHDLYVATRDAVQLEYQRAAADRVVPEPV